MVHLTWGIINLFFFFSWIYLAIKFLSGNRSFFKKHSKLYTLILIFGFISFVSGRSENDEADAEPITKPTSLNFAKTNKTLTYEIDLTLVRDKNTGMIIQDKSQSNLQGFVIGLGWKHLSVAEKEKEVELTGFLSWKILGLTLYSQTKSFQIPKEEIKTIE
ncbi:hypothetical protein JYB64_14350 [Algoriphagus aestuarii]|nr:hypothetical protein [Algoriphagus aestuarii]